MNNIRYMYGFLNQTNSINIYEVIKKPKFKSLGKTLLATKEFILNEYIANGKKYNGIIYEYLKYSGGSGYKIIARFSFEELLKEDFMQSNKVNILQHKQLAEQLHELYKQKNDKYGNSFGISVEKYGLISALTRMSDKWNRLENLILNKDNGTNDESLKDTLLDLSNYCLMTIIELENQELKNKEKSTNETI